jgi:aminotransferase
MFDPHRFVADRARKIDISGIRRVFFELGAKLNDPINFSIGQPDFDVPDSVKQAAIDSISAGPNGYTITAGIPPLREAITSRLRDELPNWHSGLKSEELSVLVTSGVSGALTVAMLACISPGDEVLISDPYFVSYSVLVGMAGGVAVPVDTYPDFQVTAERIKPFITDRTKILIVGSPSNPTGVVASTAACQEISELAAQRGILLLSDEIYDEFCYEKVQRQGRMLCPTPAQFNTNMLIARGFSKTWGMTGWRLGYVVGPSVLIEQMAKIQQFTFVCSPNMVQQAGIAALEVDMSDYVAAYRKKRDYVVEHLHDSFKLVTPGGAFYAFPKVPEHLRMTGEQFLEKAIDRNLLVIPGGVFSGRDTHFRISYATSDEKLQEGVEILNNLADGS